MPFLRSMANKSDEPRPSYTVPPIRLGIIGQQWRALLETGYGREYMFNQFNDIIRFRNRGHFDELKRYTPQEFLRALIFYGYYPTECDRYEVLVAGKRKAPAILDKDSCLGITRSMYRNTDVPMSQLIELHDDFKKQCERLFFPDSNCGSNKPEPSFTITPRWLAITGKQWHALLETDYGREYLFGKFNTIIMLQNCGHFDELKKYTPQEFLRAITFYGYYPTEYGRYEVLMAGKRKAPAAIDKKSRLKITRSTYPDTDVPISELDEVHDDFKKECEKLFFPESYSESNDSVPSCFEAPMWLGRTGQEWHELLETDYGRENIFLKFNIIIDLRNRGHFDKLEAFTPQIFLRALIFYGYYPSESDRYEVLMAGKRKAPAVLDKINCIKITRSTYPNTDVPISELIEVHDDFKKQCKRLFFPENFSESE